MIESGCFPPSEMDCYNENSYKGQSEHLKSSGLLNSELGKDSLVICRQQITAYQTRNNQYKQCLFNNGNPDFDLPTNRLIQPLLKAAACFSIYGQNSSYNPDYDLCVCSSGYFLDQAVFGGTCQSETLACQSKYGQNTLAQKGNCYCTDGYRLNEAKTQCVQNQPEVKQQSTIKPPSPPTVTPQTTNKPTNLPQPTAKLSGTLRPTNIQIEHTSAETELTPQLKNGQLGIVYSTPQQKTEKANTNFIIKIFSLISSGIKNILELL